MEKIIREACVETKKEILLSEKKKADRIELCSHLEFGGYTPTKSLIDYATSFKNSNVFIMIRRKNDNFTTNPSDLKKLISDIKKFRDTKIKGFVFGILTSDNKIDVESMKLLMKETKNKPVVFHMAFDLIDDKKEAIKTLINLGVRRILTKGCSNPCAIENINELKQLKKWANNKIELVVGGKVTDENYLEIYKKTKINQFHGRKLACN